MDNQINIHVIFLKPSPIPLHNLENPSSFYEEKTKFKKKNKIEKLCNFLRLIIKWKGQMGFVITYAFIVVMWSLSCYDFAFYGMFKVQIKTSFFTRIRIFHLHLYACSFMEHVNIPNAHIKFQMSLTHWVKLEPNFLPKSYTDVWSIPYGES
jgi:hypothetical protein